MLVAAVPAFAQGQGPITATGVLGPPDTSGPDPEPTYPLTDEETGTTYELTSGFLKLEPYVGPEGHHSGVLGAALTLSDRTRDVRAEVETARGLGS